MGTLITPDLGTCLWFVLINTVGFVEMGRDKRSAQRNAYRISENTLILLALFGGAIGIYLGMLHYHHKTKKSLFKFGVPVLIVFNLVWVGLNLTMSSFRI
jgi:uncharacterized membrane protein YsdA (DUF1294 family)